jgi:hypothetical protein
MPRQLSRPFAPLRRGFFFGVPGMGVPERNLTSDTQRDRTLRPRARCWRGPLGSTGAPQPPDDPQQRRSEGSTISSKKLPSVRVRTLVRYTARRRGVCAMPSTEYFRRQSDICLRLALIASSEEVATRLIAMAQDYNVQADALGSAVKIVNAQNDLGRLEPN